MANLTLLDIVKGNGCDKVIGIVEEVVQVVPEINIFTGRTIKGTSFKTLVRTGVPKIGFRKPNNGTTTGKSTYVNRTVDCALIDGRIEIDKAGVADVDEDGPEVCKARQAVGYMQGAFGALASQIWYGSKADKNGFQGAAEIVRDDMWMGNLAAGLTASTGSSIFAVRINPLTACGLVFGANGQGLLGQEMVWRIGDIKGENNLPVTGYIADLPAWVGLSAVNSYSIARYDNLTEDANKGNTDKVMSKLFNAFVKANGGITPSHFFMSFRSREQLQNSRSVVLSGQGTTRPNQETTAPVPTSFESVPIVASTAILDTEAITARA